MRRQREDENDVIEISDEDSQAAKKENVAVVATVVQTQAKPVAAAVTSAALTQTQQLPPASVTQPTNVIITEQLSERIEATKRAVHATLSDKEQKSLKSGGQQPRLFFEQRIKASCAEMAKHHPSLQLRLGSKIVTDRGSVLVAWVATGVDSMSKLKCVEKFVRLLLEKFPKRAAHEFIHAAVDMDNSSSSSSSGGATSVEVLEDDGETHAAERIKKCLLAFKNRSSNKQSVRNVVVGVTRWFGGTLLYEDRFRHVETVSREVLNELFTA